MPSRRGSVSDLQSDLSKFLDKVNYLYHDDDSIDEFADRLDEMETSEIIQFREKIREANALLPEGRRWLR